MEAEAEGFCFAAGGKTVVSPGWKEVYEGDYRDEDEDEEQDIRGSEPSCKKSREKS